MNQNYIRRTEDDHRLTHGVPLRSLEDRGMPFLPWRRYTHGKSPSSRPGASRGRGQPAPAMRSGRQPVPGKRRRLPGDPGPAAATCALLGKSPQEPEELGKKGGWKRREGGGRPRLLPAQQHGQGGPRGQCGGGAQRCPDRVPEARSYLML